MSLFDNPNDDAKFRVAMHLLTDLTETDDDLNLLIAVIRTYREVKRERREQSEQKRRQNLLKVVNLKTADERR